MKRLSLSALVAAGVLAGMTGANAADLGGNCCADLEERIAELEATTARKGNRKVSLTISGWVTQQISFWDDGLRSKAYINDPGTALATHVTFSGQAQINADWSAGYVLYIEGISNAGTALTADSAVGGRGVGVYESFWFVKSNALGKLSLGLQSGAADNQAIFVDGSGSLVPANYVTYDNNAFALRLSNSAKTASLTGATWASIATCGNIQAVGLAADCEGLPDNNIRYDSPVFSGFSGSASWGADSAWALSGRYAGEFNSIKLAAAIAYFESNDVKVGNFNPVLGLPPNGIRRETSALQIGAYVEHVPTGLFFYAAYGKDYNDRLVSGAEIAANGGKKTDGDNYYLKGGVRAKWSPLGHTVLFAEYGEDNDKQSVALFDTGVNGSNMTQWGLGVVQEIDAAAMSMWFHYRNYSGDQTCIAGNGNADCAAILGAGTAGKISFLDFDVFKVGALINF